MTLTEFLRARFDEDAAQIEAQRDGQSSMEQVGYWSWPMDDALRRAEREVESKRRIVEAMQPFGSIDDMHAPEVFALLALPYADHPDYRDEWKP